MDSVKRGRKAGNKFTTDYRYKLTNFDNTVEYYNTLNQIAIKHNKTILTIKNWIKNPFMTLHKNKFSIEKLEEPIKAQQTTIITQRVVLPTQTVQQVIIQ